MINQLHLFYKRRFWPLFVTQFCGAFNDNFFKQGLVFLLTYGTIVHASKSASLVNLGSILFILPFFFFSALSGEIADKYEKTALLQIVKMIELAQVIFIGYALITQNVTCLMISIFLFGVHATVFGPAKYAILPELLKEDELIAGNAFLESSTFIAILLGMMGSYIITHAYYGTLAALGVMGIFAIIGLASSLLIPKTNIEHPKLQINFNFVSSTMDVIRYARSNRTVWLSILGISWFWLIGYVLITQFPIFVRDYLHAPSIVVNFCLAMFTCGFLSGALICNYLLDSRVEATYVPIGLFGLTIFLIDLYFASRVVGTVVNIKSFFEWTTIRFSFDLLMLAFCGGIAVIPLYTFLQTKTEEDHRSRVIAANNIVNSLFMMSGGGLYYAFSLLNLTIPEMILILGFANLAVAVYSCGLLPDALIKSVVKWILRGIYKVEVHHLERYPEVNQPYIVVANHTSYLDILLLCAFLPDKFSIGINTGVANAWWIQPFLLLADTFEIEPSNPMATRAIIERVKNGKKCVIFPEGRLSTTGALMKIYEGPGMIADKAGASIVPVRIDGAKFAYPFSRLGNNIRRRLFPKITLTVLPRVELEAVGINVSNRERRRQYSMRLYRLMRDMMFESSHYRSTLFEALLTAERIHGEKHPILEDLDRKVVHYRQFIMRSLILGRYIKQQSRFGETIGLMLPTSNTATLAFFALQSIGRIPAMINFSSGSNNILHGLRVANVKQVYTSRRFIKQAKLEAIAEEIAGAGIKVHYLEDLKSKIGVGKKLIGFLSYLFVDWVYKRATWKLRPSDTAVILYTSGSEGMPKAVALSHENILANCQQMNAAIDFGPKDIVFNALPVFHCFGLTVATILPAISGIKTFAYPSPLHYRVVPELVYDCNATILFGTDTFLTGYERYAHNYDFYSIRYIFAGAEKLKPETFQRWAERFGARIFEGYGATEAAPVIASNTPMENKFGTVGRLMPGMSYRIEPVEGIKEGGRLFVKGPNVMLGYLNEDHSIQTLPDGWYDTGDIVAIDKDGYFKIVDRAKRFAKIGGEMVSLSAIELFIKSLWPEDAHACSTLPDAKKGEQIILLTTRHNTKLNEISQSMRQAGYPELFIPRAVYTIEEIPVLTSGKTDFGGVKSLVMKLHVPNNTVPLYATKQQVSEIL